MLNQLILCGRLTKDIEIEQIDDDKTMGTMVLAVPRNFKNPEGVYDTDFVTVTIFNGVASNVKEFCNKGDLVGVKGHVESYGNDNEIRLIGEKVTFLSSNKNNIVKNVEDKTKKEEE